MMKLLWTLFRTFFCMGAVTFGGGYAMLPLLQRTVVEKYGWATEEELLDYYAIGQCTPGIIAVNTATFIGCKLAGVIGGIVATLGIVAPSLLIITIIAAVIQNFMDIAWVQHAFAGIRIAVCALILTTVANMIRKNVRKPIPIALCILAFLLVAFWKAPVTIVVLGAAMVGLANLREEGCKK